MVAKYSCAKFAQHKGYRQSHFDALASLGCIFLRQGKLEKARIFFAALTKLVPDNEYYHRALGIVFREQGELSNALAEFDKAIALFSAAAFVERASTYILLERFADAAEDLRKLQRQETALNPSYLSRLRCLRFKLAKEQKVNLS